MTYFNCLIYIYYRTTPDATTTVKGKVELATDGESTANVVVQGNDSRLSNTRTPTDATVSYGKIATDLTQRSGLGAFDIDWSVGGIYYKTFSGDQTFTFSNLKLNKVITVILIGNYSVSLPSYCKRLAGTYNGSATNYIQLHCTNATSSAEEVWYTIGQEQ